MDDDPQIELRIFSRLNKEKKMQQFEQVDKLSNIKNMAVAVRHSRIDHLLEFLSEILLVCDHRMVEVGAVAVLFQSP